MVADPAAAAQSVAGHWYWLVCLPTFRFVMARFFWIVGLWIFLLWQVSRQPLHLTAAHPDRAAGLGLLEVAQSRLVVLVLAMAVIDSAALAEAYWNVALVREQVYLQFVMIGLFGVLIVHGPLLMFMGQLFQCRQAGIVAFDAFARTYTASFQKRWIGNEKPDYDVLLGSSDIQSLADLDSAFGNVKALRAIPITAETMIMIFVSAGIPHLPLLLLEYPLTDLIYEMVQRFVGI
jgi:hypothetical protein